MQSPWWSPRTRGRLSHGAVGDGHIPRHRHTYGVSGKNSFCIRFCLFCCNQYSFARLDECPIGLGTDGQPDGPARTNWRGTQRRFAASASTDRFTDRHRPVYRGRVCGSLSARNSVDSNGKSPQYIRWSGWVPASSRPQLPFPGWSSALKSRLSSVPKRSVRGFVQSYISNRNAFRIIQLQLEARSATRGPTRGNRQDQVDLWVFARESLGDSSLVSRNRLSSCLPCVDVRTKEISSFIAGRWWTTVRRSLLPIGR